MIFLKITALPVAISSIVLLGLSIFFFGSFIDLKTMDYVPEDELVYEECTFVDFKHTEEPHNRGAYTHYYYVYVEEYDIPLSIDSVVFDKVDQDVFSELKPGDKITVSVDKMELYSISYNGENILSYEDFLTEQKESKIIEIFGSLILSCVCFGLSIAIFIYYKKTGKWLLFGRRYY